MQFKLPELGENIKAGTAISIAVKPGDTVKKNQTLLELETDKAVLEVPSPSDGVIKNILIKQGDSVKVGQHVMDIESVGADNAAPAAAAAQPEQATASKPAQAAPSHAKTSTQAESAKPAPAAPAPKAQPTEQALRDVPAAPSVRRFAREIGINITQVQGSGPGGRISKEDVMAYAKMINESGGAGGGAVAVRPLPDFAKWGEIERQPMNGIRKKTAEHLSYAWNAIPHVTQFDKVDVTELEKLRKKLSTPDRKLTITPFIMKVVASAMRTFPQFNASVDMVTKEVILKKYINIGVAVDTPNGLLVPVVRDVDQKGIFQLTDDLNAMAEKARNRKTTLEDMQGGGFTITNLGGIGGTYFTPIVNWPEVAILGISRAVLEPVYSDNHLVPRLMLPLSLSYDHRLIDGADGARFLKWITEAIQQPFLLELGK